LGGTTVGIGDVFDPLEPAAAIQTILWQNRSASGPASLTKALNNVQVDDFEERAQMSDYRYWAKQPTNM